MQNTQLKDKIDVLHSKLTEFDKNFTATLVDSASAHITLAVVYIPDADNDNTHSGMCKTA